MLVSSIFTLVALLSTSVLAAPAPAPVPGGSLKQTNRAEVIRRRELRARRPARRAVVSRVAAPAIVRDYINYSDTAGLSVTNTATGTFTIPATTMESDALDQCVPTTDAQASAVLTYSIANDIYTCSYYDATQVTTVADADNGLLIAYSLLLA